MTIAWSILAWSLELIKNKQLSTPEDYVFSDETLEEAKKISIFKGSHLISVAILVVACHNTKLLRQQCRLVVGLS